MFLCLLVDPVETLPCPYLLSQEKNAHRGKEAAEQLLHTVDMTGDLDEVAARIYDAIEQARASLSQTNDVVTLYTGGLRKKG